MPGGRHPAYRQLRAVAGSLVVPPGTNGTYSRTDSITTSPWPMSTLASVRTWTLPSSARPAAGAPFAVTVAGALQDAPAGRSALASVTELEKAG